MVACCWPSHFTRGQRQLLSGGDSAFERFECDRFQEKTIEARGASGLGIANFSASGQRDGYNVLRLLELSCQLSTVPIGQPDVAKHDVHLLQGCDVHRFLTAPGDKHDVPESAQEHRCDLRRIVVVFDDQNGGWHGASLAKFVCNFTKGARHCEEVFRNIC